MGRRKSKIKIKYSLKKERAKRLRPPYVCPVCGALTLSVKKKGFTILGKNPFGMKIYGRKYLFQCKRCGYTASSAVPLVAGPIDAYGKVIDKYYTSLGVDVNKRII